MAKSIDREISHSPKHTPFARWRHWLFGRWRLPARWRRSARWRQFIWWRQSARPPNILPHLSPHMRRDVGLTQEHTPPHWRELL